MKTTHNITISLSNSKLGDKIPSLNLPPILTCRADAPCKKYCYATRGNWCYKNVKDSLKNNLDLFLKDSKTFFNDIIEWLNDEDITFKFFRWFSAGDIVNDVFFEGIIKVAKKCKNTKFLCFTKKFDIVNRWLDKNKNLPKNLNVVFSGWDEKFKIDNPYNLPTTYVYFPKQENNHIPEFAIPCKGSCKNCKSCWILKLGQSVYFNKH